jgi:hypothetical protein
MGTFGTLGFDAITPQPGLGPMRSASGLGPLRGAGAPRAASGLPGLSFLTDRGDQVVADEIADQFVLFQFSDAPEGPRILESSQLEPRWHGSPEKPTSARSIPASACSRAGETTTSCSSTTRSTSRTSACSSRIR